MTTDKRIYVEAYELKVGGFRGVAAEFDGKTVIGEAKKGPARETLEDARNDAIGFADAMRGDRPFAAGHYRNSKTSWRYNYYLG